MVEESKVVLIPIDEIIPNRFQPRLKFNEKELRSLAESISEHGIVSPIIVRKIGDKFEIIAGERRFKAAGLIGLTSVPCIIKDLDDQESAEIAVIENLQRSNLTPIEEAKSYEKLLSKGITQEQLAKRLGVSQPTIANKVRLLNLTPGVQEALLNGKISERHARSLLQISDPNMQKNLLDTIVTNRLTVKQTDDEVNALLGKTPNAPGTQDIFDVDVNEIKENAQEIIKSAPKIDFESLLRKDEKQFIEAEKIEPEELQDIIRVPDQETPKIEKQEIETSNVGSITESINPFREEETINPFQAIIKLVNIEQEVPQKIVEEETILKPKENLLIQGQEFSFQNKQEEKPENTTVFPKKLSTAINSTRETINTLEKEGFNVETEEFDFEDMYQIVIKIKKN